MATAINADDYFRDFPEIDTFYFASDGTAFSNERNAYNYANTLADKAVQTVPRPTAEKKLKTNNKKQNG
jgi:hypothetical protein